MRSSPASTYASAIASPAPSWPNQEIFRVCPWQEEIIDGLLGNDQLSFHIQYHCNNFLDTVERVLEARVDMEHFAVNRAGHTTYVRPHPISIDPDAVAAFSPEELENEEAHLRKQFRLKDCPLLVGVERADYTKGIPDRFRAVDRLLTLHPELKGRFSFFQVGAPSRTHIPIYRRLNEELLALVNEINCRHGDEAWKPIIYVNEHYDMQRVYALYRMATGCVVSSLHDGMNLVAKEFVAARTDLRGVLVLSRFTGAARELSDALLINPFATDEFAKALRTALTMPVEEQERRMRRLRARVADNNVYRWAGMLLSATRKLVEVQDGEALATFDRHARQHLSSGNSTGIAVRL